MCGLTLAILDGLTVITSACHLMQEQARETWVTLSWGKLIAFASLKSRFLPVWHKPREVSDHY